jgi:hypothetical protein
MTTTLRSTIEAQLGWTWQDHVGEAPIVDSNRHLYQKILHDGVGDGQADAVWHAESESLAQGESRDLALDMLAQPLFGDVVTIPLASVKALLIVNRNETDEGCLLVGGASAEAWPGPFGSAADRVRVPPQSPMLLVNSKSGWAVAPGAAKLCLAAEGGPVTFDIAILGTLAGGTSSGT